MGKAFVMRDVVKTFSEFQLGPLNLELEQGTVLGYIGPNGAGKTTTLQCLVGLLKADCGEIEIFGKRNNLNKPDWKYDIGFVGDVHPFYENWSGEKNLKFLSQFYPDWSDKIVMNLVKRFDYPLAKKVKTLSHGNRVKLSLISVLARSPKLLLLDEPSSGLDPVIRTELLEILFEMMESGERAIFYSTHILSDISRLADELAFLDNGKIFLRSVKEDLISKWRKISFQLLRDDTKFEAIVDHQCEGMNHQIVSSDFEITLRQLAEFGALDIQENRMSIDEIAVYIMKGGKNVANN